MSRQAPTGGSWIRDNHSLYVYSGGNSEALVASYLDDVIRELSRLTDENGNPTPIKGKYLMYPILHKASKLTNYKVFLTNSAAYHLLTGRGRSGQDLRAPVVFNDPWALDPNLNLTREQLRQIEELRAEVGSMGATDVEWADMDTARQFDIRDARLRVFDAILVGADFELLIRQESGFRHPHIHYLPPEEIRKDSEDWMDILQGPRAHDIVIEQAKMHPVKTGKVAHLLILNVAAQLHDPALSLYPPHERAEIVEKQVKELASLYDTGSTPGYPLVKVCGVNAYIEYRRGADGLFAYYMMDGSPIFGPGTTPVRFNYGTETQGNQSMDERCRGQRGGYGGSVGRGGRTMSSAPGRNAWGGPSPGIPASAVGRAPRPSTATGPRPSTMGTSRPWHTVGAASAAPSAPHRATYAMDAQPSRRGQGQRTQPTADGWATVGPARSVQRGHDSPAAGWASATSANSSNDGWSTVGSTRGARGGGSRRGRGAW